MKMNDNNILSIHNEAMDISQLAQIEIRKGNVDKAKQLYVEAYDKELCAISMITEDNTNELGQAVLLKSAAHLAVLCGKGLEAERLIAQVLRKNIPGSLITEMRDLLKQIDTANKEETEIIELRIPQKDHSFLSSLIQRMGWTANFRKVAVL